MPLTINNFRTPSILNNFRLSLTSSTPVTTVDVVNASTIYCVPYNGNNISLYNGTDWITYVTPEFSLALGTLTNNTPYDVFCYTVAGVPTLEFNAWTNTTTRATNLVYQDGILCKSGVLSRRYLGSFLNSGNQSSTVTITNASPGVITYTGHNLPVNAPIVFTTSGTLPTGLSLATTYYVASTGMVTSNTFNVSATPGGAIINTSSAGSGTHTATILTYTEDSLNNRFLFNYYNAIPRVMIYQPPSGNYTYSSSTVQIWNANLAGKLNFFVGISELPFSFECSIRTTNTTANAQSNNGIGVKSITAFPTDIITIRGEAQPVASFAQAMSTYTSIFSIGVNYVCPLQNCGGGVATWYTLTGKINGVIIS